MSATTVLRTLVVAASLAAAAPGIAHAWEITDPQSWFGDQDKTPPAERIPACNDLSVQNAVSSSVAAATPEYYGGLRIGSFERIEEAQLDFDDPSPLARRYCRAEVTLVGGPETVPVKQQAAFLIEQRDGFVGVSWGVEVCLYGRDIWRVYDGFCRTMRPPPVR